MWGLIIEVGILIADLVYHRLTDPGPTMPTKEAGLQVPTTEDGAPYPLIYGRCRVRKPVLAWQDTPNQVLRSAGTQNFYDYYLSMYFALGLGFFNGKQNIWNIWVGDSKMRQFGFGSATSLGDLIGNGFFEDQPPQSREMHVSQDSAPSLGGGQVLVTGMVEFLNGSTSQILVADTFPYAANTHFGEHMTVTQTVDSTSTYGTIDPQRVGSYRGVIGVFLCGGGRAGHWYVGTSTQVQTYSFEISSYPTDSSYPSQGLYQKIGTDANPADVIYDLLTGTLGKLGLAPSLIDIASFQAAAHTLWSENHGYSRSIEELRSGVNILNEILSQIDATLYEDPTTGLLGIKLIRNDYDPATIPVIDKTNCSGLTNLVGTGWSSNLPNKIRITFSDETNDYNQSSATAQSLANAVGQDGLVSELALDMPGVTKASLARFLAERELAARSRPMIRCTATCDQSFRTVKPGDVVKVVMQDPDIAGVVFRVVGVNQGAISGPVQIDLLQDTFYVWSNRPPVDTGFGGHDAGGSGLTSG